MEVYNMKNHNDEIIDRKQYTIGNLIEAIDKHLKTETNEAVIISLKEIRLAYIVECENYPYRLLRRLVDYLYTKDQTMDMIDCIEISQIELIENHDDIVYYIKHYYHRNRLIDNYNRGRYQINYKLFSMDTLLSKNKMHKLLKTYAVSNDARLRFNLEDNNELS